MATRKAKTVSMATVLSTTEVEWEIADWGGPLGDLMRSKSYCVVKIADTSLRFHFRSFKCQDDPFFKYCLKSKSYMPVSNSGCGECTNCNSGPIALPSTPSEHLPRTNVKRSGYMLLVDVQSPQHQLPFSVSMKMPERSTYIPRTQFVVLEPNDKREDVVAIENFYRTARWTLGKEGNIANYCPTIGSNKDVKFVLTVTLYQVESTGTDGKWTEVLEALPQKLQKQKKAAVRALQVALMSKDGKIFKADKFILESRSPFIKRHFDQVTGSFTSLLVNLNEKPLKCILHWMYTDNILTESILCLEEVCKAAVYQELNEFLVQLDNRLGTFCSMDNMYQLHDLAKQYGFSKGKTAVDNFIKRTLKAGCVGKCGNGVGASRGDYNF